MDRLGMDSGEFAIDVTTPVVVIGLFIGAMIPYLGAAMTMTAVGKAAFAMIEEVRRQFREIPGLMEGTGKPDTRRCIDISTNAALREMVLPGLMAVLAPVLVGFLLGPKALGGMLAGATVSGVLLALMMANSGGAWDNAKKWIEEGNLGGKGSDPHKAAVVGDTVGDPFKDTSGPSMNILIKLMSVVSLFYYFRIAKALYLKSATTEPKKMSMPVLAGILALLAIANVWFLQFGGLLTGVQQAWGQLEALIS